MGCLEYVPVAHMGDKLIALWMAHAIGRRIFMRLFGSGRYRGQLGADRLIALQKRDAAYERVTA